MGIFIDERGSAAQREALQTIFGGQAGGWPAQFAQTLAEVRGIAFAPIEFELAGDLSVWRAAIPGKVEARAEALTGPTTPPGSASRRSIHPAPRSVPVPTSSRPGEPRKSTVPMPSVSHGIGADSRASTFRSPGVGRADRPVARP